MANPKKVLRFINLEKQGFDDSRIEQGDTVAILESRFSKSRHS